MVNLIKSILNILIKYKFKKLKNIKISVLAKVNYRGIHINKNAKLFIGEGTIMEGQIIFEKNRAIVNIGKNTFIGGSSIICAKSIEIGNDVLIAWGCTIIDHNSHSIYWEKRKNDVRKWHFKKKDWTNVTKKPVKINDRVWIGFNSIILKGVTIGENSIIGAGSVVTKDIPPYSIFAGNPAKFIRKVPYEE